MILALAVAVETTEEKMDRVANQKYMLVTHDRHQFQALVAADS